MVVLSVAVLGALTASVVLLTMIAISRPEPTAIEAAPPRANAVPYVGAGPDRTLPAAYSSPLEIARAPHVHALTKLHLGPSEDYVVLGTLQANAVVRVIGRDESGGWLAIEFPPNSTFHAWLPVSAIEGTIDVDALPVASVNLLP